MSLKTQAAIVTAENICEVLSKFTDVEKICLDGIREFTENEITRKTANKFLDFMVQIHELAHSLDISEEQRKWFKAILTWGLSNLAESQCRGDLLTHAQLKIKNTRKLLKKWL